MKGQCGNSRQLLSPPPTTQFPVRRSVRVYPVYSFVCESVSFLLSTSAVLFSGVSTSKSLLSTAFRFDFSTFLLELFSRQKVYFQKSLRFPRIATMSEGGTEESDLEKILSKLTTTEKVVQGLLSLQNGSPPGQVLAVVEKKLEHFEELISHIPSPQKALRNTWDEKVVDLWIRFAGVGCDDAVQPVISSSNTAATTTQPAGSMANENVTSSITNQQAQDNPKDKVLQQPSVFRYASPARRRTNTRPPFSNQYRSRNLPPRLKRVYEQDNNNFNVCNSFQMKIY